MRRRLYFMLPDVAHAERALRELLLARIEVKHIQRNAVTSSYPGSLDGSA